jgi:hypothetical protein
MSNELSVGLWNVQWASRATLRGSCIRRRLDELSSQVICITEGHADIFPEGGNVITSHADFGYPIKPGRRKVHLWSRSPRRDVDTLGSPFMPPGRFVAGLTKTPCGDIRFIGVCIPWHEAHVRTGQRNRRPWEDHLLYLQYVAPLLRSESAMPTVLLGDFNQRIPCARQPKTVFSALTSALAPRFRLATAGPIGDVLLPSIDHVAPTRPSRPDRATAQAPGVVLRGMPA